MDFFTCNDYNDIFSLEDSEALNQAQPTFLRLSSFEEHEPFNFIDPFEDFCMNTEKSQESSFLETIYGQTVPATNSQDLPYHQSTEKDNESKESSHAS